jgi:serine/threonine protein kinase
VDSSPIPEDRFLGKTLAGKYQLFQVRARGAFGTVFLAHQFFCKQFVRPVAVKVSHQTGLTEETAPYLFGDAVVLAQVLAAAPSQGKMHLVAIHDMGLLPEHEGRGFLVLEYVDGEPLLAHMRAAGRVGAASGLRYAREICQGLAVLHSQGAVHRDLKPDNVLLDRAGVVRLVDFGLASFVSPRLGFAPGDLGNLVYMAPETFQGQTTPASDVYALGLVLYELFAGGGPHLAAPWPARNEVGGSELACRIKHGLRFPPPSQMHNEIRNDHRWLDDLILRCLESDPARRFPDARKVLAALQANGVSEPGAHARDETKTLARAAGSQVTPGPGDSLIYEARRLLAGKQYAQAIDLLDVHRPAEWAVLDLRVARILRLLGQAYLGLGQLHAATECLEALRAAKAQPVLPRPQQAALLNDLIKCYCGLGREELAEACRQEARQLWQGNSG